jgi:hypothetical protein
MIQVVHQIRNSVAVLTALTMAATDSSVPFSAKLAIKTQDT